MAEPKPIQLSDYQVPNYLIPEVNLVFQLEENQTWVENTMRLEKNPTAKGENTLFLNGENLKLIAIERDGSPLAPSEYTLTESGIFFSNFPDKAQLKIKTQLFPHENKSFSGLYKTKTIFCTQMEAEGFRNVTFFQDRPDVLSKYTTTLFADKSKYPVLLSNGELVESKSDLEGGLHMTKWHDPFVKPCYLFALVAGDLDVIEDTFTTESNKKVDLAIYVDKGKTPRARHAMLSLKQSMKWDEETYGLEYDLNVYNIVAVDDFNMGAMENKGLNIFNSKYVLADAESATDDEFTGILRVIGHEYFHNWTGNRVTCRDWFQLSLKEGLTVFRDQEFTCELTSREVKRIEDVNLVRTRQFPEDAGPMAHPVRPQSYISIDNFYTVTVYMKGAEVIRMLQNIIGVDMFKKGLNLYFERHDGQAVTTDDFVHAMETVSEHDLSDFRLWYSQAGTPELSLSTQYDEKEKTMALEWSQKSLNPHTKEENLPFHIPVKIGALDKNGGALPFSLSPEGPMKTEALLELKDRHQIITLYNINEAPTLSLLRDFTAPVKLNYEQKDEALYLMMIHDSDAFNRWDSSQKVYIQTVLNIYNSLGSGQTPSVPPPFLDAIGAIVKRSLENPALSAQLLQIPSAHYVMQFLDGVDPQTLHQSLKTLKAAIAKQLRGPFLELYNDLQQMKLGNSQKDIGLRSLKNTALGLLGSLSEAEITEIATEQFSNATNMTDRLQALKILSHRDVPEADQSLSDFYEQWKDDPLVINKYFSTQALSSKTNAFETLQQLESNSVYDATNPNNIYALIHTFASENWLHFHQKDGRAYQWFAGKILDIDSRNPQVASRLASVFNIWKKLSPHYQAPMKNALEKIHKQKCSNNLFEIVDKALH